jgi:tripartite-type tricarboxylate transporter receptor subunit TctC
MQQAGVKDFEAALWLGVVAPAGTPDAIVKQLHAAILKTVKDPTVAARLRKSGAEPVTTTPAEMGKQIQDDLAKYVKLAKDIGLGKKK